jgi:hypothetical protein
MPESEETASGQAPEDREIYHNVGPDRRFPNQAHLDEEVRHDRPRAAAL